MKKTVIVIVLLALAGYIYSLISGRPRSVNRPSFDRQLLEEKFSQFEGFDTDPVIPFFQDGGQESVGFLAEKLDRSTGYQIEVVTNFISESPVSTGILLTTR